MVVAVKGRIVAVESKAERGRKEGRAEAVRCNCAGFVLEADSRLCVKQRDAIRIVVCLPGLLAELSCGESCGDGSNL